MSGSRSAPRTPLRNAEWRSSGTLRTRPRIPVRTPRQGLRLAAIGLSVGFAAIVRGCTSAHLPLDVVDEVDLDRYLGRWYEIASYPAWFQRNCTAVTADYSLRDDGLIEVVNSCRKGSLDGKLKQSKGRAKVIDEITSRLSAKGYDPKGLDRTLQPDLGGEE